MNTGFGIDWEAMLGPPSQDSILPADHPGRGHWRLIHDYPITVEKWIPREASIWFDRWQAGIPTLGCDCRKSWDQIMTNCPSPDFSSRLNFFRWGWARHTDVNDHVRLSYGGHPNMSFEDALLLYNAPSDWQRIDSAAKNG